MPTIMGRAEGGGVTRARAWILGIAIASSGTASVATSRMLCSGLMGSWVGKRIAYCIAITSANTDKFVVVVWLLPFSVLFFDGRFLNDVIDSFVRFWVK